MMKTSGEAINSAFIHMRSHKADKVAWVRAVRSETQCSLVQAKEAIEYVELLHKIDNSSTLKELRECVSKLASKVYG